MSQKEQQIVELEQQIKEIDKKKKEIARVLKDLKDNSVRCGRLKIDGTGFRVLCDTQVIFSDKRPDKVWQTVIPRTVHNKGGVKRKDENQIKEEIKRLLLDFEELVKKI